MSSLGHREGLHEPVAVQQDRSGPAVVLAGRAPTGDVRDGPDDCGRCRRSDGHRLGRRPGRGADDANLEATCVPVDLREPERAPGPLVREHRERPDRPGGHPVRSRQVCGERPVKAVGGAGAGRDNDRGDPEPDSEPVLCDQSDRGEQAPETDGDLLRARPIDHDAHFVWGLTASGREHETNRARAHAGRLVRAGARRARG